MARSWPVVRRENEFTAIHNALVEQTGVCGIVLVGDAGVGKTTLARLVTQSLPLRVQWVAGTESARSIPLGVFAHLVGTATSRDPVAFLSAARESILAEGRFGDRCRRCSFARSALGNAASSAGDGRLGAHRRHGAHRGDGARRDHHVVEGRLPAAAEPHAVHPGSVRHADRGGTRRPRRGAVGRPDVGGVRRERVVRPASGRGGVGGRHASSGSRRVAAAGPDRGHVRVGVAAGLAGRPAAGRRAAHAAVADVLRAAQPRRVVGDRRRRCCRGCGDPWPDPGRREPFQCRRAVQPSAVR